MSVYIRKAVMKCGNSELKNHLLFKLWYLLTKLKSYFRK